MSYRCHTVPPRMARSLDAFSIVTLAGTYTLDGFSSPATRAAHLARHNMLGSCVSNLVEQCLEPTVAELWLGLSAVCVKLFLPS